MVTLVRSARVMVIIALAFMVLSFVMGIGTSNTGWFEKVVLLALIGLCIWAAALVTTFSDWVIRRLHH